MTSATSSEREGLQEPVQEFHQLGVPPCGRAPLHVDDLCTLGPQAFRKVLHPHIDRDWAKLQQFM